MRWVVLAAATLFSGIGAMIALMPPRALAAEATLERKARVKPSPTFPEIAKKMHLSGTVRIMVTVAPNGTVVSAKAIGGHPLLVESALDAVKKWRFEPSSETTTGIIPFEFKADAGD